MQAATGFLTKGVKIYDFWTTLDPFGMVLWTKKRDEKATKMRNLHCKYDCKKSFRKKAFFPPLFWTFFFCLQHGFLSFCIICHFQLRTPVFEANPWLFAYYWFELGNNQACDLKGHHDWLVYQLVLYFLKQNKRNQRQTISNACDADHFFCRFPLGSLKIIDLSKSVTVFGFNRFRACSFRVSEIVFLSCNFPTFPIICHWTGARLVWIIKLIKKIHQT